MTTENKNIEEMNEEKVTLMDGEGNEIKQDAREEIIKEIKRATVKKLALTAGLAVAGFVVGRVIGKMLEENPIEEYLEGDFEEMGE